MKRNKPKAKNQIWKECENRIANRRATMMDEKNKALKQPALESKEIACDYELVAANLALMHEAIINWIGQVDEALPARIYLATISEACLIRTNKQTGDYESALILLTYADEYAVVIDTGDESIMAGTGERLVSRLELPCVDVMQREIRRCYNITRRVKHLDSMVAAGGETVQILLAEEFRKNLFQ